MTWKPGAYFDLGEKFIASQWRPDSRGCFHLIGLTEAGVLKHYVRGSRSPFPIDEGRIIDAHATGIRGSGDLFISIKTHKNLEVSWPAENGIRTYYADPLSFPDPSAGTVVVLDKALQVPTLKEKYGRPISISPVLIPTYGIEKNLNEDLFIEDYLNRGSRDGLFNATRFFSFGVWEAFTAPRVLFPYNQVGGKFDCYSRNEKWIETLDRRIGQIVERGGTAQITIVDNCSLHNRLDSHWGIHPWNGFNNINGTATWNESVYHFYEDEHKDKPGMKETAIVIELHVRYLISKLDAKYRPHIMWEICNESHAGEGWHRIMRDWLTDEGVKDDWRIFTSMDAMKHKDHYPFLEFYKKRIYTYMNYAAHGIQTPEQYKWMRDTFMPRDVKFIASEDGLEPGNFDYRELVNMILKDDGLGYEGNERPWWHDNIFDPNLWNWTRIEEIAKGWADFLNG